MASTECGVCHPGWGLCPPFPGLCLLRGFPDMEPVSPWVWDGQTAWAGSGEEGISKQLNSVVYPPTQAPGHQF